MGNRLVAAGALRFSNHVTRRSLNADKSHSDSPLCRVPRMSKTVKVINEADSDVSDLDQQQLGQAMVVDKWAPQLGYCEDPETPLTADTFPSKSGGKPVCERSLFLRFRTIPPCLLFS